MEIILWYCRFLDVFEFIRWFSLVSQKRRKSFFTAISNYQLGFSCVRWRIVVLSASEISPSVECLFVHSFFYGLPIYILLIIRTWISILLHLWMNLRGNHIIGPLMIFFDFLFRTIAIDLSLLLSIEILNFLFGTIIEGWGWLWIVINDETPSRLVHFIACPLERRRIVIPIH